MRSLRAVALALVAGVLAAEASHARQLPVVPKKRAFSVVFRYRFHTIPPEVKRIDCWFAMPFQDDHQLFFNRYTQSPYSPEFKFLPDGGNELMYMRSPERKGTPMQYRYSVDVERTEDLRNTFRPFSGRRAPEEIAAEKELVQRWLKPETLTALDQGARTLAGRISSGKSKPLEKARAAYAWVLDNMTLLKDLRELQGAGYGNLSFSLKERKGDSLDLAAVFVGLSRAAGVPARSITGLKIPPRVPSGSITSYHGWAEFYLEGIGWIPVDPADAKASPARRSYYFGALDENRLAISVGRDIVLDPPQAGSPLNYFTNPYWEGDGRPMPNVDVEVEFTSLDEIPNRPLQPIPSPARVPKQAGPS